MFENNKKGTYFNSLYCDTYLHKTLVEPLMYELFVLLPTA